MTKEVRVSQVLARLQDFGDIPAEILQNKANIGTDVHAAITAQANKEWFPLEEDRRVAYFDSYGQWHKVNNPEFYITEKRLWDYELCLTGQIDALVKLPNPFFNEPEVKLDLPCLIDFKTSAKESFSRDGMSIWAMQAHLYYHLLQKNGIKVQEYFFWIQLRTKKNFDGYIGHWPKVYTYKYDQKIMDRCLDEVRKYWEEYDEAKIFN